MSICEAPRARSSVLCKRERGHLLTFRIVVKEHCIENLFHAISVTENAHRSGSPLELLKGSFNEVSSTNLLPQGDLSFLNVLSK